MMDTTEKSKRGDPISYFKIFTMLNKDIRMHLDGQLLTPRLKVLLYADFSPLVLNYPVKIS